MTTARPRRQTKEQQYALITRAQSGDGRAIDELITGNHGLITKIATYYHRLCQHLEFEDLLQEGRLGMLNAILKFDTTRGLRFSTYANLWIRQSIGRALDTKERAIRIPHHILERRAAAWKDGIQTDLPAVTVSLDLPMGVGITDDRFSDFMVAPNNVEAEVIGYTGAGEELDILTLVEHLTDIQKFVITCRYNLDGGGVRTMQEIGDLLGVTREAIRVSEIRAITRLQQMARPRALRARLIGDTQ